MTRTFLYWSNLNRCLEGEQILLTIRSKASLILDRGFPLIFFHPYTHREMTQPWIWWEDFKVKIVQGMISIKIKDSASFKFQCMQALIRTLLAQGKFHRETIRSNEKQKYRNFLMIIRRTSFRGRSQVRISSNLMTVSMGISQCSRI